MASPIDLEAAPSGGGEGGGRLILDAALRFEDSQWAARTYANAPKHNGFIGLFSLALAIVIHFSALHETMCISSL